MAKRSENKARIKHATPSTETAIKRVNERLAELERKGLGTSERFKGIVAKAKMQGFEITQSKKGTPRISRSKANITRSAKDIEEIEKIQGYSEIKRRAKKSLKEEGVKKPSEEQIKEHAQMMNEVQHLIENYKEQYYRVMTTEADEELTENESKVKDMLTQGFRRFDYREIKKTLEEFVKNEEKLRKEGLKKITREKLAKGIPAATPFSKITPRT